METRLGCHCAVKYHPIVFMSPSHFEPVESVRANNKLLSLDIFKDIRKRGKKTQCMICFSLLRDRIVSDKLAQHWTQHSSSAGPVNCF